MYDLIIIGGGPAGITAGIYAIRKKLKTLLITKDFFSQITKTSQIDNWPGDMAINGMALALKLEKHLKEFPVEIKNGQKVVSIKEVAEQLPCSGSCRATSSTSLFSGAFFRVQTENNEEFETKSIIVATGRNAKTLGIEGEQDFVGKGLSYCSICDAPFFKDKQVGVIGGGNAGLETALDLAKYAKKVIVFEQGESILADEILQDQIKATGKVEITFNAQIVKIEGQGRVQSIVYKNLKENKVLQQPMDGIFVQIGSVPATGFLGNLVKFNNQNEIIVDNETFVSSVNGIFAVGDCNNTKWKQAIVASGQGAVGALSVYEFLQNKE